MLIVLDTNIIFENWMFDKPYHRAFVDYIDTVNCNVVFPQIIWSEIEARYRSQLKDALKIQASANGNVAKLLFDKKDPNVTKGYVDIDNSYANYSTWLLEKLRCGHHSIIDYPSNILPILAEKAIARIKPFGSTGEEFRDAILWHSVLEIAEEYEDLNPVVLISRNTKEFSDSNDKSQLHPELQIELKGLKDCNVLYYSSLEDFIKYHHTPIAHIDSKWIEENVYKSGISDIVRKYIMDKQDSIMPYYIAKYPELIFAKKVSQNQIKLTDLRWYRNSMNELFYTHKNGEVSLFIDFDGKVQLATHSMGRADYNDFYTWQAHNQNMNQDDYTHAISPENVFRWSETELTNDFRIQIEFKIDGQQLSYSAVAGFELIRATVVVEEDDFLPF